MKKVITSISMVFCVLFISFVGNTFAEETEVKFAIGEWEPYTGKNMELSGMAVEIVRAACNAAGLQETFEFLPWKRAENQVMTGSYFGTFPYKEMKERMADYNFSTTLFTSSFGVLIHKNNAKTKDFQLQKPEDLLSYTIGIVTGTDAIRIPLEEIGVHVEDVPTSSQNIKKLEVGRIDFYIDDKAVIFQALRRIYSAEQMAGFVFLEGDFGDKNDFKIMISKKYPQNGVLLEKINDGINKIIESGEHKAILTKYGL